MFAAVVCVWVGAFVALVQVNLFAMSNMTAAFHAPQVICAQQESWTNCKEEQTTLEQLGSRSITCGSGMIAMGGSSIPKNSGNRG